MIPVTIFVGIVSVQHLVLTTSLSLGIVMTTELAYRLLVTLLFASEQQWGVDYGRATAKQINYPIAFSKFAKVVAVDGFYNSTRYSKSVLYGEPVLSHFKFTYDTETDFVNWIAIGV